MKLFQKFRDLFLSYFFKQSNIIIPTNYEITANIEQYLCGINFRLTKSNEVVIEILNPDIGDYSVEEISAQAETFANLMVMINNGLLKKDMVHTIKDIKKNNMNNDKITLLMDNILFFNHLLSEELKTIKKELGPMVKPSAVFKS